MISKKTKYALHALTYLAEHATAEMPVAIHVIASETHVSFKFLDTILRDLKHAGITASKMGKEGGYYLLKQPAEIHLAEIVRLLDGPIALLPCVSHRYYEPCKECPDEEACKIRNSFLDLRAKTVQLMKDVTIADWVKDKNE
ncbi:MAG: Rrf2 family transcriptional regulator [Bacteroidetes bacterium]|nr:Rrf2 family transcriptional regulator [Bacteroidota bacterium]NCQ11714.1 Rrf2 family transcriptional regulator [Bacteroidota bacterium]